MPSLKQLLREGDPDSRVVLIGEAPGPNTRASHPLFPHPPAGSGARLQQVAGLTRREYCRIRRINLLDWCPEPKWPLGHARRAARKLLPALRGRTAFLLGTSVQQSFDWVALSQLAQLHKNVWVGRGAEVTLVGIPHPSGRSTPYNEPEVRQMVGDLLAVAVEADDFIRKVSRLYPSAPQTSLPT